MLDLFNADHFSGVYSSRSRCQKAKRTILSKFLNNDSRWLGIMRKEHHLGQETNMPMTDFDVEGVEDGERIDGWLRVAKDIGHYAATLGLPVNVREHGVVVGSMVAAEDRNGDLWGLVVWMVNGETAQELHGRSMVATKLYPGETAKLREAARRAENEGRRTL